MARVGCLKLKKFQTLLRELHSLQRVVIAFPRDLDSTFLLHAAQQVLEHRDILAITCTTDYIPESKIEQAKRTAIKLHVRHQLVTVPFPEELGTNPKNRCYLCKLTLFAQLRKIAAYENIPHILDGTNLDAMVNGSSGCQALTELGVTSPLLLASLTKQDVRDLSKEDGLVWDNPSSACLLTRIPHGTRVEPEELRRIDLIEDFLKDLGFTTVRLRSHGDLASIEVPYEQVATLIAADKRHGIDVQLRALGYRHVTVDLAGYLP